MIVLVCGGREYADERRAFEALDTIHAARPITRLVHGCCRGADRLAAEWARRRSIPLSAHPADWGNIDAPNARIRFSGGRPYNAAAGFQRNIKMLEEEQPDLVVAFPGGSGTEHTCKQALKRGVAVMNVQA